MEARDAERQAHNLKTLHKQVDQYLSDYNSQKVMLIGLGPVPACLPRSCGFNFQRLSDKGEAERNIG